MDQSKSNKEAPEFKPKRSINLELVVGFFSLIAILAIGYLSVNLGGVDLNSNKKYSLFAEFNDISGLSKGSSIEIGGVKIGDITNVTLVDYRAQLELRINKDIKIQDDDIALIRTKGIIGDKYVKISRGGSGVFLEPGETIFETEDVVDIEDIIGKLVHSFTGNDEEDELDIDLE